MPRIRAIATRDFKEVCAIHLFRFRSLGVKAATFKKYAAGNFPGRCLVAEAPDGRVVGYASWKRRSPRSLYCGWLAVAPGCERRGIAKALMRGIMGVARKRRARHVVLDTRNRFRAAIPFYLGLGFDIVSVWRGKDGDRMIRMTRALR